MTIFCPFNKVLPKGTCCCLQTCNFEVICILMNVCVQSFNFIQLACASYDHIYAPIIMYRLRLFVVVLQKLHCYKKNQYCENLYTHKISYLYLVRLMSYACGTEQQQQRRQQRELQKWLFTILTPFPL